MQENATKSDFLLASQWALDMLGYYMVASPLIHDNVQS